ncbi:hypothetical protein DLM76_12420 [Leptospira yasudae]|uniref:hypothetical protein n=1 Tax=Leptospira yasudae TaxID=2202201 RepID=UPI000E59CFCF|nr:hypothetical protein [Leptospira yasudae]RHX93798.1 hypothetical protein DLM76_12420 [Leptospira yasudae]
MFNFYTFAFPFFFGLVLAAIDEFYFHWKRGLPTWERIGHSIDIVFTIIPYSILIFFEYDQTNLLVYVIFALISCMTVVKDVWVHNRECEASEEFIHGLMSMLHPILLLIPALLWPSFHGGQSSILLSKDATMFKFFFTAIYIGSFVWLAYNFIFWNMIDKGRRISKKLVV